MIIKKIKESELKYDNDLMSFFYPNEFVSQEERNKPAYIKRIMDYYGSIAFAHLTSKKNIIKNYKLRNGEFDFNDYTNTPEINQLNDMFGEIDQNEFSYLKHYPIINSPLNTLKGELIGRARKERVKAVDDISSSEVLEFRTQTMFQAVMEKLQMKFQSDGQEELPEEFYKELSDKVTSYSTAAESWGNKALKAFKYYFNYPEKNEDGFMDFLTSGEEFHHMFPDNSLIGFSYKVENPVNVWYLAGANAKYTKDCHAVGTIELKHISEIIDEFKLDKKEIDELTKRTISMDGDIMYTTQTPTLPNPNMYTWSLNYSLEALVDSTLGNAFSFGQQQYHVVIKSYWKGKQKIFKRIFLDEEGYQRHEYVGEDYKFDAEFGDIKLEEEWVNKWFTCTRIGQYVYTKIEELEFNDTCPIVGIVNHTKNTKGKSLVDLMKAYQAQYNVCMNQVWDLLSKEIGVVFLGDIKLVPKKQSDNPIEEMLYEAKERGAIFIDTSIENAGNNLQFNQLTRVDLTRSAEIQARIQLAQTLRQECWELIGISRQRVGSVLASETATGTNTALAQSYSQTEPWFKQHEDLMQQVLQSALNIMQYTELKKPESILNYLNSDLDNVFFKINRNELLRNLFVFVTSAKEDKEKLDIMKGLLQPAMQNGAELSDAAAIMSADSENRVKDVLKKIQERKEKQIKQAQEMEQQQMAQQQEQFQAEQQRLIKENEDKVYNDNMNKQLDREADILTAQIRALGIERNEVDNTVDINVAADNALKFTEMNYNKLLEKRKLDQKDRELSIKEKDSDNKLKIARENKNKHDKKK
jgi:hypothetical protein